MTNGVCGASCLNPDPYYCFECDNNLQQKVDITSEGEVIGLCRACAPGFFYKGVTEACKDCQISCKTCVGEGSSKCTSCQPSYGLVHKNPIDYFGHCYIGCQSGQYRDPNSFACNSCHSSCLNCQGPESNHCISCVGGGDPSPYPVGRCGYGNPLQTAASCLSKQFFLAIEPACVDCHSSCKQCSGPNDTDCTGCTTGSLTSDGKCSPCIEGKFLAEDGSCRDCHESCKTCSEEGDTNCIECKVGFLKDETQCSNSCPIGKFDKDGTCTMCHSSCQTCQSGGWMFVLLPWQGSQGQKMC